MGGTSIMVNQPRPLTNDPTVGQGTERLNELGFGFKKSQALAAAIEFGLFTAISEGASTPAEIARHCAIETETADRLLIICKAMDLVREVDGQHVNLDDVERYLVRTSQTYFGDYLRFTIPTEYVEWQGFPENIREVSADLPPSKLYEADLENPETARAFTAAGYNASIALAHRLAKRFDFSPYRLWLDFAGGSGCYAIAACERHPDLRAIVMDHPNVVPVAREFIAKHGLENRIEARPGNFLHAGDYPEGCDLISFITPLHWYLRDDVLRALQYAFKALEPGGSVLIVGYMLNDDRSGPLDPAFYHLHAIRQGHYTGHVPSGPQYVSYLAEAGFEAATYSWFLASRLGQIEARKPTCA
jgi:SAM-dependent methyltransferase